MRRRTPPVTAVCIAVFCLSACSGNTSGIPAAPGAAEVNAHESTATATAGAHPTPLSGSAFLTQGESGAGVLVVGGSSTTFRDAGGRNFALVGPSGYAVEKWSTQPSITITSAASGSGALVVVGTKTTSDLSGTAAFVVQRLDGKTGKEMWSNDLESASEVSYGLGSVGGGVVELVTSARANKTPSGGEDGTAYTSLTSHFLDIKTGRERFSFGKCDPRTPGAGGMDGQMLLSLDPLVTRPGSGTVDENGKPQPCTDYGPAQVRSLATGKVSGDLSDRVLPTEYAPLQTVFGSGKNLVVLSSGQLKAMTPDGKQVWARDAGAAQVLAADEEHVVVVIRQTHKVVVLDAHTGKSVKTIPDTKDEIDAAVMAGPHLLVLAGIRGSMLYPL